MAKPRAIVPLSGAKESLNLGLYGDSGSGKTAFGAMLPDCLILATEAGTVSAQRRGSTADVWACKTWDDVRDAYGYLLKEDHPYKWVFLDTTTKMQQLILRDILEKAVENNRSRNLDIPAIQDHQEWQNRFKRFIDYFVDLPVNVLFSAQAMIKEDEDGDDLVLPSITGKNYEIASYFCAALDMVMYLRKTMVKKGSEEQLERGLLLQPIPPYFAKDRLTDLGKYKRIALDEEQYFDINDLLAAIKAGQVPTAPKGKRARK